MTTSRERCAQCDAEYAAGSDCESCFHALLAFENERPQAFGAVHHLTVATYYLQHPRGYTPEALDLWQELLSDSLSGRAQPAQLRKRAAERFEGPKRVRSNDAAIPSWWPTRWPMTVQSVLKPTESIGIDEYIEKARAWAESTSMLLARR